MLKKVRQMQKEIEQTQAEIAESTFTASAGGVVTVSMKGTKELVNVIVSDNFTIDTKEDTEMLGEMVVAACNQAYREIEKTTEQKMSKYQAFLNSMGSFL